MSQREVQLGQMVPKGNDLGECQLRDVLKESTLLSPDSHQQIANTVAEFNRRVVPGKPSIVSSIVRGRRISPDELYIAHRNMIPHATTVREQKVATTIVLNPGEVVGFVGVYKQTEQYLQAYGSSIINVKNGQYGKIYLGSDRQPLLLGPGPHVFHDPTLAYDDQVDQSSLHIAHGTIHVVRVPLGHVGKIWMNTTPLLLESRSDPYVFNSPLFRYDGSVPQYEPYIAHGTRHILRVPAGKLAKIWVESKPFFLEARQEPYEFNTPYFLLEPKAAAYTRGTTEYSPVWFEDATTKLIVHGSLKRIIPQTGEVAVTYENGVLRIVEPSGEGEGVGAPTVIDSATCQVDGFVSTGIQTLMFPSEATRQQRKHENPNAPDDEINYEVFSTKDSLKIGVKLLVAYKIIDPAKTLRILSRKDIVFHVENLCAVDMGKAIQLTSSQEFLCFYQTTPAKKAAPGEDVSGGILLQHVQDTVKSALSHDLAEYGIQLVRLNFETPKILDPSIAQQMQDASLLTSRTNAKEAVLTQNYKIARTEAEQQAEVQRITQDQLSANQLKIARTEFETAKLRADALVIEAEARSKVAALEGQQYLDHPVLFQLKMAQLQADAMSKAQVSMFVTPEEMRTGVSNMLMGGSMSGYIGALQGAQQAKLA